MSSTVTVESVTALKSALESANPGDTILLAPGDYGRLALSGLSFSDTVTIRSADPEAPAVFDSVYFNETSHVTLDAVSVLFTPTAETQKHHGAVELRSSDNITISNSYLEGGESPVSGQITARGVASYWSSDITLEGNEITQFGRGVMFIENPGVSLIDNHIHHVRTTPIGASQADDMLIEGNHLHSSQPVNFGGDGDHGDFIHLWTKPDQPGPSQNITIRDNYMSQGDGTAILGIYLDDNSNRIGYENVVIEGNVISNGNGQGIRLEQVNGGEITSNTLVQSVQSLGDTRDAPGIVLAWRNSDITIDDNIIAGEIKGLDRADQSATGITIGENLSVQSQDPLAPDHVSQMFVNATAFDPSIADLAVLPGSLAEGFGADLTKMTDNATYVSDSRHSGLELNQHDFALRDVDGALVDGTVVWDFGDGTSATGAAVTHSYAASGSYEVTATVTPATGAPYLVRKTADALSPEPLSLDFNTVSAANAASALKFYGDVSLEAGHSGQGVSLREGGYVAAPGSPDLRNNPEFSISLAVKKDANDIEGGGRVLTYSGTAVVDITADGISLRAKTSTGDEISLRQSQAGLGDSDWHQITYTFSSETGTAVLYVDGAEVDRETGLTGVQHTTGGHALSIGNPRGGSFDGVVDNVVFLRGALTEDEVRESYTAFEAGEMLRYAPEAPSTEVTEGAGAASPTPGPTPEDAPETGDQTRPRRAVKTRPRRATPR